ncbi:MAG TPA: hypothetical protein VH600_18725 [Burkholderiales bacterium]|jgi:hypothetical protein
MLALVALQLLMGAAHACRFAQDAQPAQWYEWASSLFSADVTSVESDAAGAADVISLRVVETFKGPADAAAATLRVPSRMWTSCRLERPAVGAHVLVALNPNSDTLLVPLAPGYSERLRHDRGYHAPQPQSPPQAQSPEQPQAATPTPAAEKPFHY